MKNQRKFSTSHTGNISAHLVRFGTHAEALHAKGFKLTAIREGTKGGLHKGWRDLEQDIESVKALAQKYPNDGIGIQMHDHLIALDVDLDDREAAKVFLEVLSRYLEPTGRLVRRIGQPPRFALIVQSDEPIKWEQIFLSAPNGLVYKIELIAEKYQLVAFNRHEDTGKEYYYPEQSPLEIESTDELACIKSREALGHMITEAIEKLGEGWEITSKPKRSPLNYQSSDKNEDPYALTHADIPTQFTDEEVFSFLNEFHPPGHKHYNFFRNVGMGIHHHFEGSDRGYQLWVEWSSRSEHHDVRYMRKWWDGFSEEFSRQPITAATLKMYANEALQSKKAAQAAARDLLSLRIRKLLNARIENSSSYDELRTSVAPNVRSDIVAADGTITDEDCEFLAQAAKMKANGKTQAGGFGLRTKLSEWREQIIPIREASITGINNPLAKELYDRYAYRESNEHYLDLRTGVDISRKTLNTRLSSRMPPRNLKKPHGLRHNADEVLAGGLFGFKEMRRITGVFYEVEGEPIRKTTNGWEANQYKPGTFPSVLTPFDENDPLDAEIADMVKRHLRLISDDDEATAKALLDNLAHRRQRPNERIYWAVALMSSTQGNGKSFLETLYRTVLGNAQIATLSPSDTTDRFNTYMSRPVLATFIQEPEPKTKNSQKRFNAVDLKDAITAETASIRNLYQGATEEPLHTQFFMFSNFEGALGVEAAGRRWLGVTIRARSDEELKEILGTRKNLFFTRYAHLLSEHGDRAAAYLETIDLASFDRHEFPETRHNSLYATQTPEETMRELLRSYIDRGENFDIGPDVVNWRAVKKLVDDAITGLIDSNDTFDDAGLDEQALDTLSRLSRKHLLSVFRDAASKEGFVQLSQDTKNVRLPFQLGGSVKANTVWYRRNLVEWNRDRQPKLNEGGLLMVLRQVLKARQLDFPLDMAINKSDGAQNNSDLH